MKASVIICTYNRKEKLYLSLLGYQKQTCRDFEVIVTFDGSSDGTTEMMQEMRTKVDYPLHYLWQEDQGFRKSIAVNHAIAVASGKILIFADDDMVPPVNYVRNYIRVFEKFLDKELLVYSKYLPVFNGNKLFSAENILSGNYMKHLTIWKRLHLFYWSLKYRRYFSKKHPRRPKLNGNNFAASASAIRAVNGLDQDFVGWGYEDDDLRRRLLAHGVLQSEAVSQAFNFNLGYEKKEKTTENNPEMLIRADLNKSMAYDASRPARCKNGLNLTEDPGLRF